MTCHGCRYRHETITPGIIIAYCTRTGALIELDCPLGQIEEPGCPDRTAIIFSFEGAIA